MFIHVTSHFFESNFRVRQNLRYSSKICREVVAESEAVVDVSSETAVVDVAIAAVVDVKVEAVDVAVDFVSSLEEAESTSVSS